MSVPDRCQACGRPASPWHDSSAPGPTVRHMFVPPESPPAADTVSELRSWFEARIAEDQPRAARAYEAHDYDLGDVLNGRVIAFRDVLDHLDQLEGRDT